MANSLRQIGITALTFAVSLLIERLVPAIAVGLVAAGHELHNESAQAESKRRARFCC